MSAWNAKGRLTRTGRLLRSFVKRYIYAQLAIVTGVKIAFGKASPLIRFTVEDSPPSIYWVFRFLPTALENLEETLGIAGGYAICPIQCLVTDAPEPLLVLNAYRVSGLANGLRAEWSTFIRDEEGIPRYQILDAGASQLSMDPIHIFTRPTPVIHEGSASEITTRFGNGVSLFSCTMKPGKDVELVQPSAAWVAANDTIYWANGIYDQTFYNAGLAHNKQLRIPPRNARIELGEFFRRILDPNPVHILALQTRIEFVVSPWKNIDAA